MTTDEKYMARCVELARNGRYHAAPNPMVGAVVVCQGRIIGEGFHARCGSAHAEVNAINAVKDTELLKQSTLYVSLEPCSHHGKTPPCADLIIRKQIPRVVVGCTDPFHRVAGRGIEKLRAAGCEVVTGVLEEACKRLNKHFFTSVKKGRPFITLKWAESADGFIDVRRQGGRPTPLSSPHTRMLAHKRRAQHMAILVGTRTALLDTPQLDVRHWCGNSPLRVVIDRALSVPANAPLLNGLNQPTMVVTALSRAGRPEVEYVTLPFDRPILPQLLEELQKRNVQSLLVEGGSATTQAFIDQGLWDEAYVECCPQTLGGGVPAPHLPQRVKPAKTAQVMGRTFCIIHNFT